MRSPLPIVATLLLVTLESAAWGQTRSMLAQPVSVAHTAVDVDGPNAEVMWGDGPYGDESVPTAGMSCGCGAASTCCPQCCDCCPCGPCCCPPCWEATASALFMQRMRLDAVSLYTNNAGQDLLNADDFHFDWEPGVDVSLAHRLNACWTVRGRYLWLNDQEDRSPTFNLLPPNPNIIQTNPPTGTIGPSNNLFATYRAEFQSAEINLERPWCDGIQVFAGFRYVRLNEQLHVAEPEFLGDQSWNTRNDLYGGQVGADGLLVCRNRWSVFGRAAAGLFANNARSDFRLSEFADGAAQPATALSFSDDSQVEAAFLGELNLVAEYRLDCGWSVSAGYQLLWMEGVAIAAEQVGATTGDIFVGPPLTRVASTINVDGSALYHGVRVGVSRTW